ncbi:hypothetical protein Tco_1080714 [Tanacetum coccineum]|uniref:Uncharacterized protein n=1 Tax=Tanacetum coccineum TaxID=301880 RepID=A0ABQ5HVQ0_9ASTR
MVIQGAEWAGQGNSSKMINNGGLNGHGGNSNNLDARRFGDVVNGGSVRMVGNNKDKYVNNEGSYQVNRNMGADGAGFRPANKEKLNIHAEKQGFGRCIEIEENELNSELMKRSVVGEVKARCFLTKLPALCEEQGLNKFQIKLLGGLEVMVVTENEETAENVLKDREHGLRRWLYKLRRGDS